MKLFVSWMLQFCLPEHLYAYLSTKTQTTLSLFIFDIQNPNFHKRFDISDIRGFLQNFPAFCQESVRLFICNVFGFNHPDFPHNFVFCLIQTLEAHEMSFHFVTNEKTILTSLLIAAKVDRQVARDVAVISVLDEFSVT